MSEKMEIVELHQAFAWDCPECGREQFERSAKRTLRLSIEEAMQAIIEQTGEIDPEAVKDLMDTEFHMETIPMEVICKDCKVKYETDANAFLDRMEDSPDDDDDLDDDDDDDDDDDFDD